MAAGFLAACSGGASAGSSPGGGGGDGGRAALECDAYRLDFGVLLRGESRTLEVHCENTGDHAFSLVAGPVDPVEVAIEPAGGVEPGEAWTLSLTWTARDGFRSVGLPLFAEGGSQVASLALQATAVDHCLDLSLIDGGDFGVVPPGRSATLAWEVTNACERPGTVTAAGPEPGAPAGFAVEPAAPLVVPAAHDGVPGRAGMRVEYSPAPAHRGGAVRANFVMTTDDPALPRRDVPLHAYVGGPALSCSPPSLDFGLASLDVGITASVTCANTGIAVPQGDEDLLSIEGLETSSGEFAAAIRGGPRAYEVGEEFVVDVTYRPVDEGADAETLWLRSNAFNATPDAPVAFALGGRGQDLPPCDFEIVPQELRWGLVEPDDVQTVEFAVRNHRADAACVISGLRLSPGTDPAFSLGLAPSPSIVLEPSAELRIPVLFAPTAHRAEPFLGTVLFELSNPSDVHQFVPLRGGSAASCLRAEPASLEFPATMPGCAGRDREVELVNACGQPITITRLALAEAIDDGFFLRSTPPLPAAVAPGARVPISLAFRPVNQGVEHGRAFVFASDTVEPLAIHLFGEAVDSARQVDTWTRLPWTGTCYFLGNRPALEDGPIEVTVDGRRVEPVDEAGTVWTYVPDQIAVCFEPARAPADGSTVEISYPVNCLSW